ncbi:hypothetical protein YC2023_046757 [Brassica napus]
MNVRTEKRILTSENEQGSPNNSFKRCKARTAGTIVDITGAGKYGSAVPQKAETSTPVDKFMPHVVSGNQRTSPFSPSVAALLQQSHRHTVREIRGGGDVTPRHAPTP